MPVILTLHYPKTGIVQTQDYPTIHPAIAIAHGHLAAFPDGFAQIIDAETQQVLMPHEELRGTFEMSRRRDESPEETAAPQDAGLFARWFGQRTSDSPA